MAINGIRPAKRAARTQGGLSLEMHGAVGWSLHAMRNTLVTDFRLYGQHVQQARDVAP